MQRFDAQLPAARDRVRESFDEIDAALARRVELRRALDRIEDSKFARARSFLHLLADLLRPKRRTSQADDPSLRLLGSPIAAAPTAIDIAGTRRRLRAAFVPFARANGKRRPDVSIVVPVFNHAAMTARCLISIADAQRGPLALELIVVDDCSTDETPSVFGNLPDVTYLRADANGGFIDSCNLGARAARGRFVCFLNNDTVVRPGWIEALAETLDGDATIGAAGSKLIYPDGRLQEAGGIVWRDASGWNYGRDQDPRDPQYNFARDVDYCSGASLLVRRDLFVRLGGFNVELRPAYYEDADLCFGLRELGYRVVYQPRSEVVHFEGASSGTDVTSGTKRFQELNRPKFAKRWRQALARHDEPDPASVYAAARRLAPGRGTVLFIDSYVPMHDREAGSLRLLHIIRILAGRGLRVLFYPDNNAALSPYTEALQALGVEVIYHVDGLRGCRERLDEALSSVDVAWICRPELCEKYLPVVRAHDRIRVVYDTIDLHFVRMRRRLAFETPDGDADWQAMRDRELACALRSDETITVTAEERDVLRAHGVEAVSVVPTIHERRSDGILPFAKTSGILFIGGYNHTPNVDAATWLVDEIMPLVWKQIPDARVTLLGSRPPQRVLALAGRRVAVPGFLPDVDEHFRTHRLFVAPLRYGAGQKGKIGQALSFGMPIVTTRVGAEGFELHDGRDFLAAETAGEFAESIVRLYRDRALWNRLSANSRQALRPLSIEAAAASLDGVVARALGDATSAVADSRAG